MAEDASAPSTHDAGMAELYAQYPYPDHGVVSTVIARMLREPMATLERSGRGRGVRVLDAGCGTGEQTLGIKRRYRDSVVLGVDANPRSIERARHYATRSGIDVRFEEQDLLQLTDGVGEHDLVVCIGVLHHLADPGAVLRNLADGVAPGGVLLGMVYGTYGKWRDHLARDAIHDLVGDLPRDEQLRAISQHGLAHNTGIAHLVDTALRRAQHGPDIAPLEVVRRVLRGRNPNYQADTFTHTRERTFTWDELDELLSGSGWSLLGWPPRAGMPRLERIRLPGDEYVSDPKQLMLRRARFAERMVQPANLYFLARAGG